MGGIVREFGGIAVNIDGSSDHVHLLIRIPVSIAVAEAVKLVKTNSSRWVHEKRILHRTFAWQTGYAAFSVSQSKADEVSRYITNQEVHHRKMSFQEELVAFLKKGNIPFDERYIWS
jgi:putative transposase